MAVAGGYSRLVELQGPGADPETHTRGPDDSQQSDILAGEEAKTTW